MNAKFRPAAVALLAAVAFGPDVAAATPPGVYTYKIHHPTYGDVGTYVNEIVQRPDGAEVKTKVRIAVKLVGAVTLYRLESDRREEWRGGRLASFASTTDRNGKATRVEGRAEGDAFVIEGPRGTERTAPDVWPANPWSPDVLRASVIMTTASGRLYEPKISTGDPQTVSVRGQEVPAKHYRIMIGEPNELWFDGDGRLVKFTTVEDDQVITLTLQ